MTATTAKSPAAPASTRPRQRRRRARRSAADIARDDAHERELERLSGQQFGWPASIDPGGDADEF